MQVEVKVPFCLPEQIIYMRQRQECHNGVRGP